MVMQAQHLTAMATSQDLRNKGLDDNCNEESGVPACLQWARDLETLLNDDKGCDLFESYLQEEQCDLSELNFIYACTGLRIEAEPELRDRRARTIYRHYVKNNVINSISEVVKAAIKERIDDRQNCSANLFDDAVKEVKEHVTKTTFARFIQSDLYVSYVQDVFAEILEKRAKRKDDDQDADVSRSSAPAPSDSEDEEYRPQSHHQMTVNANTDVLVNQMPTLTEEDELENFAAFPPPPPATTMIRKPSKIYYDAGQGAGPPPPLPSKTLQLQKRQSQRGLQFAENIKQHGHRPPPNPYHVKSSSFVPPSAYNSEIQSMSSGGGNYTELELLQDLDIHADSSRKHETERRKLQRSAFRNVPNVRANLQQSVIPRTMFALDPNSNLARDNPQEFYQILYRKLLVVARERDSTTTEDESNNQSILDNHLDRVFGQTPVRTPGSPPDTSPPLGASNKRGGHKSPYHLGTGLTRSVSTRKDDNDSAIYLCSSGTSTSVGVPMVQPRKRTGHAADSGCEESIANGTIYSLNENVREWVNRSCHETTKSKNKSSVCSGSNRSSRCGQEEKDKKKKSSSSTSSKESGVIVGYQYEGEEVPFVIRLPYKQPRLRDFKAQLTKKGHYRYFFKRSTNAFGSKFVFEEVTDDEEELPMCDGKIFARIHPNEQFAGSSD